jgi:hypothetical protein
MALGRNTLECLAYVEGLSLFLVQLVCGVSISIVWPHGMRTTGTRTGTTRIRTYVFKLA